MITSLSITHLHTIDKYDQIILYIFLHTIILPMDKNHSLKGVYYCPVQGLNFFRTF